MKKRKKKHPKARELRRDESRAYSCRWATVAEVAAVVLLVLAGCGLEQTYSIIKKE